MGKKRIIKQTQEELLKEEEKKSKESGKESVIVSEIKKPIEVNQNTPEIAKKASKARIYINASYNNTIITVADPNGNVLTWASAGAVGFKGARKSTPFAASKVAEVIAERVKKDGISEAALFVKGIGSGRESAIRAIGNRGINITSIKDVTPVPHNGCRPPKMRRV